MPHSARLGILLLIGFTVTQGLRDVYVSSLFGSLSFFDTVFVAFSMATVFFSLVLCATCPEDFGRVRASWLLMLAVNLTTAAAWLCYFGALVLVEPSVVNTVFSGVAPMAVALLAALGIFAGERARALPIERLFHGAILVALILLGWVTLTGRSGYGTIPPVAGLAGLLLAAGSGLMITTETIFAKRMNERGVSSTAILAFRFLAITAIGAVAVLGFGASHLGAMEPGAIGAHAVVLFAVMVAPLFLVQKGLALTSPLTAGVVTAYAPSMIFVLQAIEGRIPTSPWVLAATLLYAALTTGAIVARTWYVASVAKSASRGVAESPSALVTGTPVNRAS